MIKYPNWINEAEELFKLGYSFTKIGESLNVNRKQISYYLKSKGYKPNHKNLPRTRVIQKTHKNINSNIFEKIDNEEKAYWLGFLYADGHVSEKNNRIELALKEDDLNHIIEFKSFMDSDHVIGKKIKKIGDKEYVSYRIGFSNIKIKNDLVKLGCTPNKTHTLKFPKLKKSLVRHFIRGYFDGDGCVRKGTTTKITIEILGTDEFLKQMGNHFEVNNHIYSFKHSKIKRFVVSGEKAIRILNYLYKDATIYLERKYHKYLELAVSSQHL